MIDFDWLTERLCEVLRWQLANTGQSDHPDAPEVPWAGRRVWGVFLDLNAARTSGGFGPNPIGNVEIEAYARLHRETLRSFEVNTLRALDMAYMKAASERNGQGAEPAAAGVRVSTRPFSLKLFDALFPGK